MSVAGWDDLYGSTSINEFNGLVESKLNHLLDVLAPVKTIVLKNSSHIGSLRIEVLRKRRNLLFKRMKSVNSAELKCEYLKANKYLSTMIVKESKRQILNRIDVDKGVKSIWKIAEELTGKSSSLPNEMEYKNCKASSDAAKAELFAKYFQDNLIEKSSKIPVDQRTPNATNSTGLGVRDLLIKFTELDVVKAIKSMKSSNASGIDGVPSKLFIDGVEESTTFLTFLFNRILREQSYPDSWKTSKIIPIHKKGLKKHVSNYRPVSNIPTAAKIFERCLLNWLTDSVDLDSITGRSQHGFKKGCSTETALLELQNILGHCLDQNRVALVVSLDLSAAFDLLDKDILFKKMENLGLPKHLNLIVKEWLSDRWAYVSVNNANSSFFKVNLGCVQGSVIGPILFSILVSGLDGIYPIIVQFADDNYVIFMGKDLCEARKLLESTIPEIILELNAMGMVVNEDKTDVCYFSCRNQITGSVSISNHEIIIKDTIRALGVVFDSRLKWSKHVTSVANSVNKSLFALRNIQRNLPLDACLKVAKATIIQKMFYCCSVWLNEVLSLSDWSKVWRVSSSIIRICVNDIERAFDQVTLHDLTCIKNPIQISNYFMSLYLYKIITSFQPECIYTDLISNHVNVSRSDHFTNFIARNIKNVGKNCFANRVNLISTLVNIDFTNLSKDQFKRFLKSKFNPKIELI
jgi:hypothetical protein